MSRVLIRNIQLWSVVRSLFPIMWLVITVTLLAGYLMAGSMIANLVNDYGDILWVDESVGVGVGIVLSLLLGFFGTILMTLSAVIFVVAYNLFSALGGGIVIELSDEPNEQEAHEQARNEPPGKQD